ncbi:hypothetical protein [Ketobacter alkanivorans]|uniref:PilZ domain-containing protein n=1 Tax=Ketobacter alkanivorans TaxID=1917421 RepID=A0A2K9LSU7_9GAMM|nr:hypothetical protein [Ketobacter alkanivorans]AUM14545.1 hypothetical protein Kalk_19860 [Ketobacter alkanivorans]MCP5013988.1 hypothetical protein [Ketobacter sp.]
MNGPLRVPTTERTQHLLLDADNRRLSNEIRDLPYVDIPSALTLAFRRLHTFNRFALAPAKRLQIVSPFHYAFVRFLDYYRNQLTGSLFSKDVNSNELDNLLEFIQELGFAYKHIIKDALARQKRPSGFATVLYMAMLYQYYYGLFSYNRGRMLKRSHWREFHYLYFLACDLQQEDKPVTCPEGKQGTVSHMYKQSLLMGLASPYAMSAEDQWRTCDYTARFASLVDLMEPANITQLGECYFVEPECLQPANIPGNLPGTVTDTRVLDLSRLLDTLYRHLTAIKSGESLRLTGLQNVQRKQAVELLDSLSQCWSRNPHRSGERHDINEQIGLVWGLENICTMLDPTQRRMDVLQNRNSGSEKRAWSHGRDESTTGIRVKLNGDPSRFPEAGQVVAMIRQINGKKVLEVGLVRWAAISREDAPECGIERLRGNVKKITISKQDEQATDRNGLLILLRSRSNYITTRILAPAGALKLGSEVSILAVGHHEAATADVRQIQQRSRQVEVFDVQVIEN